ncbi:ribosome recycling factor [Candidatus Berkelbacteria bacterium CG_4_9_14_0_2_um_filter_42_30]|uniref:Ribosome-recycling factor n=6 Tax=Candidatus Berkelbacteria TaxID=1618330 RepID=A0A2M7K1P0_9BACT|nr:MAG: ribosome recycling factor [Candidatus Berkelbacteria bacterium CG23_combo_of_CG06-09_8_20_14_all_41_73]PIR27028.1 MAG: ribosome recycling factor [Candidatus Berkelbacteria bacterium CG11_big_fil_rev_8_21_14_0_20_42_15]PIX30156.1 MAG: ribosome recycling factor [Candidatus Berkelbacteria bacterium CG_4_8_14_3_um_filter_42_13]PIZ27802.1 MAG: ribosome recycling factor [Candidatus Berkelbacteria bacterium CG_4_10_14_0_8_um_filter_42_34]PJC65609.1 MAG: ribosome recycling factor [Candidatus Be
MMIKEIIKKIEPRMDAAIRNLGEELKNIRTGRANSSLVEDVPVTYYGTNTPLKQLASINIPEPTMFVVTPWDKQSLGDIEIALRNAETGLSIVNDGHAIRITLPPLTGERREELSKLVHRLGENARVAIRNIRGEAWDEIQKAYKNKEISEDEKYRGEKELNDLILGKNRQIEEKASAKTTELGKI